MRRLLPLALVLLACEPVPPPAAHYELPIVDGTFESGEEAVVLVTAFGAVGLCTGTLIAPNVVLTAKHCVQAPGVDGPYPVTALTVGVGSAVGSTTDYRAAYVETTPGVYSQSGPLGLTGEIFGVDVAVLVLRQPVEGVTPIPIRRERPDDMLGQEFTAIGFGRRPDSMRGGEKYKGDGVVETVMDNGVIMTAMTICSGDSGGPMIQETPERRVIGVASFGQANACPSNADGYNAVWNHLDLIDRALTIGGNCLGLEETCNSIDDDCDGEIDEGCVGFGEACTESSECANAQLPGFLEPLDSPVECVDLGAGSVCTRACDPMRPISSCGVIEGYDGAQTPLAGHYCRRDGCSGWCAPGGAGTSVDGSACGADTECASLSCADPGDGMQRCVSPCRPGQGECPLGEVCVGDADGCGACVDGTLVSGGRSVGEPCNDDSECGEMCVNGACTVSCNAAMPCVDGYRCDVGLCVRGLGGLGDPCDEPTHCGPGLTCTEGTGRMWCTAACDADSDCADGMTCEGGTCAPAGGLLGEECTDVCADGICEDGRCTRACGAGEYCAVGFECRRDGAGNPRCLVPEVDGGGCAASSGELEGVPTAGWLMLGLVGLLWRRRTR